MRLVRPEPPVATLHSFRAETAGLEELAEGAPTFDGLFEFGLRAVTSKIRTAAGSGRPDGRLECCDVDHAMCSVLCWFVDLHGFKDQTVADRTLLNLQRLALQRLGTGRPGARAHMHTSTHTHTHTMHWDAAIRLGRCRSGAPHT